MCKNVLKRIRISGVVLIDKPVGPTSQQVVSKVKYLLKSPNHNSKKAGHTGTLDPMATGLLPVCLGEATKFSHYQLEAKKTYQATIKLGVKTDTGDAQGQVIETLTVPSISQSELNQTQQKFTGNILQIPPMYSALKKEGKKLYEYAREGVEIERLPRPITIYDLDISMGLRSDELIIKVTCSKGTYIRVLGEDIATALKTVGHLIQLRRTQVGYFDIKDAISLTELESISHAERLSKLLPADACIDNFSKLYVSYQQADRLRLGQRLNVYDQINDELTTAFTHLRNDEKNIEIRIFDNLHNFIGLGCLEANGRLQPKKMLQI